MNEYLCYFKLWYVNGTVQVPTWVATLHLIMGLMMKLLRGVNKNIQFFEFPDNPAQSIIPDQSIPGSYFRLDCFYTLRIRC